MPDNIFSYAGGGQAAATDINHMPFEVRESASTSCMVPGIQYNLLSTAKYTEQVMRGFLKTMNCKCKHNDNHFKGSHDERVEDTRRRCVEDANS